jgi:hypothetical protein
VFSAGGSNDPEFDKQLDALKASGVKLYWVGAGSTDMARPGAENLEAKVKEHGFNTTYRESPGGAFLVHLAHFPERFWLEAVPLRLNHIRQVGFASKQEDSIDSTGMLPLPRRRPHYRRVAAARELLQKAEHPSDIAVSLSEGGNTPILID